MKLCLQGAQKKDSGKTYPLGRLQVQPPHNGQWDTENEYVQEKIRQLVTEEYRWAVHAVRWHGELVPICVDGMALKDDHEGDSDEPDYAGDCHDLDDALVERIAAVCGEDFPIEQEDAQFDGGDDDSKEDLQHIAELSRMSTLSLQRIMLINNSRCLQVCPGGARSRVRMYLLSRHLPTVADRVLC